MTSPPSPPAPRPSLLTLPFDIHHLLLATHLSTSPSALKSLRSTCLYFAYYIPVRFLRHVRRRRVRVLARLEAEEWAVWYAPRGPGSASVSVDGVGAYFPLYLACFECLERCPRWGFVEGMTG